MAPPSTKNPQTETETQQTETENQQNETEGAVGFEVTNTDSIPSTSRSDELDLYDKGLLNRMLNFKCIFFHLFCIIFILSGQLLCAKFPTRPYPGGKNRSFRLIWMDQFEWLRYSKTKDAAFCVYCVKYASKWKFDQFAAIGYTNWKKALNVDGGFKKHERTTNHMEAIFKAQEHVRVSNADKEILTLLTPNVLSDRRYYFSKIISVIRFIAQNALPFRGSYDKLLQAEGGIVFL